jgi:hypothetical protein
VAPQDTVVRLYANGTAQASSPTSPTQFLSFSIEATQDPLTGRTLGTLFLADSQNNHSFIGAIQTGTLVRNGTTGVGDLDGVIGRQVAFHMHIVDNNSDGVADTLDFSVAQNIFSFSGAVIAKDIRIVRAARPVEPFELAPVGTQFDSAIGLYVVNDDFFGHPRPDILPEDIIDLTPPEPIIDFQRNALGGLRLPPGSADNVPGANAPIDPFLTPLQDPNAFPNNNQIKLPKL